jgi:iron(III) transport system substrate-binding protein
MHRLTIAAVLAAFFHRVVRPAPPGLSRRLRADRRGGEEGRQVVVYSALDTKAAQPLIKDFNASDPDVKVEYNDMNSTELYNRYIAEVASGQGGADVLWSSAMDLQVKLVDEGKALTYKSPEASKIPRGPTTRTRPGARPTSRRSSSTTSGS